ncbi:MAG: Ig-like domain repeat protein [Propionibacteriaceae bacterium]|nr:Ig-like domain repeat protein [Propionibacteriaceae bacterium]
MTAKLAKATVKSSAKASVKVTVKATGLKPGGKVKVTYGKKSVTATVKSGKATVKLPKLKKGKYTLKVTYLGSTETKKATYKKTLKLKVK